MRNELLKTFRGLMRAKGEVILPALGLSMYPYILPGDECRFGPISEQISIGQVGLFVSDEGVLLSHRLHRSEPWNDEERYWLRGDGNFSMDTPIGNEQLIGVLIELKRHGKKISEQRIGRRLWSRWAVRYPRLLKLSAHASRLRARREAGGKAEGGSRDGSSNRSSDLPGRGEASRKS